jgi:hypothetical protein
MRAEKALALADGVAQFAGVRGLSPTGTNRALRLPPQLRPCVQEARGTAPKALDLSSHSPR